jgi:hypothetical protein
VDVEFYRVDGRSCVARAIRADGAQIELRGTAKNGLPHDLEHMIVESALALEPAFWSLVAAGAEFKSMSVQARRPRRKPRSTNRDLARRYDTGWAEQVVGEVVKFYRTISQRGWMLGDALPTSWATVARRIEGWPVRVRATQQTLTEACLQLAAADSRWSQLEVGQHLVWTFSDSS